MWCRSQVSSCCISFWLGWFLILTLLLHFIGTTKIKNLDDNIGSVKVNLTQEELQEISLAASKVAGPRSYGFSESYNWKYANTPLPSTSASA